MKKFLHKTPYKMSLEKTCKKLKEKDSFNEILSQLSEEQFFLISKWDDLQGAIINITDTLCRINDTVNFLNNAVKWQIEDTFEIYETGNDWFKDNFDKYLSQDLTDKYFAMISGLDDKSKMIFDIILHRLMSAKQNNWTGKYMRACSLEKQELAKIKDEFTNRIITLNNGWYSYKEMLIPSNNFEPCIWYYHHFINEIEDLKKVRKGNIIDAGGYIGDSAIVLSAYTDEKVYSFEPHPKHIELMKQVIDKNNCTKIIPVMKGLGSKEEKMYMPDAVAMGNTLSSEKNGVEVEVTTLDKYVKENNLEVSLIKVDIEGFERYLLQGALETIKSQKPALLISIYHNGHDFFEIKPWIESLNLGYKFKIRKAWDCNITRDTILICEIR